MQAVQEIINVFVASVVSLAVLFILTRLGGKRQIAQMNLFDYVNSITIGSIAAEMATNLEQWYRPLTAMIVYGIAAFAVHYGTCKNRNVRLWLSGQAIPLMENGTIYISATETALHCYLFQAMEEFNSLYPNVRFKILNNSTTESVNAVKEGKVDLAFVSANLQVAKPLRMKILRKYHDILISGNRFGELKDDGKEVSLKELVSYPWISLTAETITRRFLNEYFEKNSLTFTPDMELATTDMILPAVRHNLGLGFIPAEFADSELKSGQVFEIKVKEKLPERNIILIYDVEYPQSIAAKEFQKFLKEKEM